MKFEAGDALAQITQRSAWILQNEALLLDERRRRRGLAFQNSGNLKGTHFPREAPPHGQIDGARIIRDFRDACSCVIDNRLQQVAYEDRRSILARKESLQSVRKTFDV